MLVVDDDASDYTILCDMLSGIEGARFDLDWRPTYDAALEAIQGRQHDVYIFDYHLNDAKERSGLDLVQEARDAGCTAPALLLTGRGSHDIDFEAMKMGAVDYLDKTELKPSLLERSIRYAIERKRVRPNSMLFIPR